MGRRGGGERGPSVRMHRPACPPSLVRPPGVLGECITRLLACVSHPLLGGRLQMFVTF